MRLAAALTGVVLAMATGAAAQPATRPSAASFDAARAESLATSRPIVIRFTGSDWNAACRRLIADWASLPADRAGKYVLLAADFPERPAGDRTHDEALRSAYGVIGLPTVIATDADGVPFFRQVGYSGAATDLLSAIDAARARATRWTQARDAASSLPAAERARALHAIVEEKMASGLRVNDARAEVDAILAIDADGALGLRAGYLQWRELSRIEWVIRRRADRVPAAAAAEKLAAEAGMTPTRRQEALWLAGVALLNSARYTDGVSAVRRSIEAMPDGPRAKEAAELLRRLPPVPGSEEPKPATGATSREAATRPTTTPTTR